MESQRQSPLPPLPAPPVSVRGALSTSMEHKGPTQPYTAHAGDTCMAHFWPNRLWLIRHGQSQGNVARDAAEAAAAATIDIDTRDVDVPLSDLGHAQARAAGAWFAALPAHERPEVILSSPYLRARQTARTSAKPVACRANAPVRSSTNACASVSSAYSTASPASASSSNIQPRPFTAPGSASSTTARPAARAGPTSSCASVRR